MRSMRVPKRETCPESARINPLVILSRTVLPAPLPPMTASVVPLPRARLTPCRTSFCSKDFRTSRNSTRGPEPWVISPEEEKEELGEEEVGDDHRHGDLDHRAGGGPAESFRASFRLEPVVAADKGDEPAEGHALAEAAQEVLHHHPVGDSVPVEIGVDVTVEDGDVHEAYHHHRVGQRGHEWKDDEGGEDAGHDELLHVVDAEGAQGVDLLRHLHGA